MLTDKEMSKLLNNNCTEEIGEHYTAIIKCLNCGDQWSISIPHGTLVSEWLRGPANNKCQNCKCDNADIVGGVTC